MRGICLWEVSMQGLVSIVQSNQKQGRSFFPRRFLHYNRLIDQSKIEIKYDYDYGILGLTRC